MTTRDIVATLNIIADQINAEGMPTRAGEVRKGAIEITRLRLVIDDYEKERISKLGGIGSPA